MLPALTANYCGQDALVLADPKAASNPFYLLVPHALLMPAVALATAATIIASQAVISGAFTLTNQRVQLGLLPRLVIRHTSAAAEGQIYVPQMNAALAAGVLLLVFGFGFVEQPNIPKSLSRLAALGLFCDPMRTSYFLGRETIIPAAIPRLGPLRRAVSLFMLRNAIPAKQFFRIPSDRVVELGVRVAI